MITAKAFNKWLRQTWWVTDKNAYIPTKAHKRGDCDLLKSRTK